MIKISTYIHFTKEQREQARRTDLANFLVSQGEKVKKSGSEYEWLDGSQKVTIRGHLWYHQYEQKGMRLAKTATVKFTMPIVLTCSTT